MSKITNSSKERTIENDNDHSSKKEHFVNIDHMFYTSRMKYLDDGQTKDPNNLFLSRKQAQRHAEMKKNTVRPTIKKIETMTPHNIVRSPINKKNIHRKALQDAQALQHKLWESKFQAGCYFWQNTVTGECVKKCPISGCQESNTFDEIKDDDIGDDSLEYPDSFKFLDGKEGEI